ncbi:hypothetical protein OAA60_05575 [Porticoccaceae bacterium]|nr:hypothetical protein [Porticoccaceae bacterium]
MNSQNTPEKLYYDIQLTNLESNTSLPPVLNFIETRNVPFLYNADEYYMSIIRFSLDTPNLPIFIPTIQLNQPDINLTIYTVCLQWTNPLDANQTYTVITPVMFIPQSRVAAIPPPPSLTGIQYNGGNYYNVYNYQYFIYLINEAFIVCYNQLKAEVEADGLVLPSDYYPVLSWDTQNNTAIVNVDVLGYSTIAANYIKIFFNTSLAQLFSSFPVIINSTTPGLNAQLITNSFNESNIIAYPPSNPTYDAIQVFQEYSTIALWSPITAIVFTSNTLPIISNQVSTPIVFNNGSSFGGNGNNSLVNQVITDFISDSGIYKPNLVYEPTAQYRWIELLGNRPLTTFDLQVYWKDRYGVLNPFYLSSGSTASIKILFSKKHTMGTNK